MGAYHNQLIKELITTNEELIEILKSNDNWFNERRGNSFLTNGDFLLREMESLNKNISILSRKISRMLK